jgi:hypothetical protein
MHLEDLQVEWFIQWLKINLQNIENFQKRTHYNAQLHSVSSLPSCVCVKKNLVKFRPEADAAC